MASLLWRVVCGVHGAVESESSLSSSVCISPLLFAIAHNLRRADRPITNRNEGITYVSLKLFRICLVLWTEGGSCTVCGAVED